MAEVISGSVRAWAIKVFAFIVPSRPCLRRRRLRIGDESNIAIIEPIPIFPPATWLRSIGRGLRIGKSKPALVIPQVVVLGPVPFVVAPHGHIGRVLEPNHHVVELLVDCRLPA